MVDVTFWGVRGSTPCPCDANVRYGGNTACVTIESADHDPIILDLGTGLRFFGERFEERSNDLLHALALVTHDRHVLDRAVGDTPILVLEGNGHVGYVNSAALSAAGVDRTTPVVNIETIRFIAHHTYLRTQFPNDLWENVISRSIGTIQDNSHILKVHFTGKGALDEFNIPSFGIINAISFPNGFGGRSNMLNFIRENQVFNTMFQFIRQLHPVIRKKLYAVILIGIVRGRNHHTGIGSQTTCHECNRWGR